MRAMILAAGRGERMRPLTDQLPKPLLPAGGKPLIAWHIERLVQAGIRDIVVNHAWLGEKIVAALGDGSAHGARIRYSAEGTALETAGGIARALPLLTEARDQEPFLVVSGDTWCDFDYGRAHTISLQMRAAQLACWLVMVPNPPHHAGGDFALANGRVKQAAVPAAAGEAPAAAAPTSRFTYAGIGVYTPRMFAAIATGTKSPLRPWLEREIAADRAAGEYHGGLWFDIGTAQRLAELDLLLAGRTTDATHAGAT
jgi:MurNAc alpha-1-phosphate uridylyltransferase